MLGGSHLSDYPLNNISDRLDYAFVDLEHLIFRGISRNNSTMSNGS